MTYLDNLSVCHHIVQIGLALLIQSSLILLLGFALSLLVHQQGPRAMLIVSRATLTAVVIIGLAALIVAPYVHPVWHISLPNTALATTEGTVTPKPNAPPTLLMPQTSAKTTALYEGEITPAINSPAEQSSDRAVRLYAIIVGVWGFGTFGLLSWFVLGQMSLLRLRRDGKAVTEGPLVDLLHNLCSEKSKSPLTLLMSPQVRSPFLAGLWRSIIFLPTTFEQDFHMEEQTMILAHEVAHWRHRDNIWKLLTRLTCAALWWQPLLWLLARQMAQASEESCDIAALTIGCPVQSYANCLLSFAERLLPTRLERSLGNGILPFRSSLGKRIHVILRTPYQKTLPIWFRPVVGLVVVAGMVLGLRLISGADAPASSADVVRQYIADRAAGRLLPAYNLLSTRTQKYIAYTWFSQPYHASTDAIRHYPASAVVKSLFREPRDPNIRFEVVGTEAKSPNTILVRAYQPETPEHTEATIHVVTLVDPKTGSPKLDLVQTGQPVIPGLLQSLEAGRLQRECASHLKEIGLAMLRYIQDHDEHFPHADHWIDEIMPYVIDTTIFHDPAAPADQKYSYAFNRNLSGIPLARVAAPAEVVMVFDSDKGFKNASDTGQSLPHSPRHTGGNDYAFADIHVKWMRDSHRPSFVLERDHRF